MYRDYQIIVLLLFVLVSGYLVWRDSIQIEAF